MDITLLRNSLFFPIITGIKFMGMGCYAKEGYNNIDMYGFSQSLVRIGQML